MLPTTTEQGKGVAVPTGAWGAENTSSKDLVVPRIGLAQASSNVCKEGLARPGELIHSQTKVALAAKGAKLELLPILIVGYWEVTTPKPAGGGFPEFIRKEELTPQNDSTEWRIDDFEEGRPVVRNKILSFLTLPVSDTAGFPYFVDFKGTNKNGGKLLSTIIQENRWKDLPACARVVELSTTLRQYKGNSWFVVNVTPGRAATEAEMAACRKWYDVFHTARITAAEDSDDDKEVPF